MKTRPNTVKFAGFSLVLAITASSGFAANINIVPGLGLTGNAPALAAFNAAAQSWSTWLTDPVDVEIHADMVDLGSTSVIGSASSTLLLAGYTFMRDTIVADAAVDEAIDDAIVASLPTAGGFSAYLNSGFGLSGNIVATKANLKALGINAALLDSIAGTTSDADIAFNSGFAFDYDRSNGIAPGAIDFQSVALHEIGHALGFASGIDLVDFYLSVRQTAALDFYALDLFRFLGTDSVTAANFGTAPRSLVAGLGANFSDGVHTYAMSTGFNVGDGRQASHWKDDGLTGNLIGVMDPTLGFAQTRSLTFADLRALDMIGWDFDSAAFLATAEPGTFACTGLGIAGLIWLRRRRAA